MKKKVLKSIGILALAAFVGLQGSVGTVRAAESAVMESGETALGEVAAEGEAAAGEAAPGAPEDAAVTSEGGEGVAENTGDAADEEAVSGSGNNVSGGTGETGSGNNVSGGTGETGSGNNVSGGTGGTGSGNNVSGGTGGTGSGNNVSGGTGTEAPAEKTKLATPEISWDGWSPSWHDVAGAEGFYGVEIFTKKAGSQEWVRTSYPPSMGYSVDDSGICRETRQLTNNLGVRNSKVPGFGGDDDKTVVRFRVRALGRNEALYEPGEWSDWCEKVYNRPAQELKAPECRWDEETPGLLRWTPVEGAKGYVVVVYNDAWNQVAYAQYESGNHQEHDLSQSMANWSVGKYHIHVRALSADIDACANSDSGEIVYEVPGVAVSDVLSEAMETAKTDPRSAVGILMRKADPSELANAMQTDAGVLNQIKELERLYMEVSGNTVASPVVTEAAGALLDASKIDVAGAGFNGWNNAVSLHVDVAGSESAVDVPSDVYDRSVQLDIRLVAGERHISKPNLPVAITIPVPSGMDAGRLAIVHYGADGQGEDVSFKNNGDGTVTFTVTHFSTFLFGEKKSTGGNNGGNDGNNGNNGNNGGNNGGGNAQGTPGNTQNGANAANAPVSPQTGQEASAVSSTAALLAALCGAAAAILFAGSRIWKRSRR